MAMRRSRGARSLTILPPMRISPAVGCSRPAIMRRRVDLPESEGPRKTRNSPSRVTRFTLFTAPSSPSLNTLVRSLVSTTAIQPSLLVLPAVEDALVFLFGGFGRVLRGLVASGYLGKHRGNDVGAESLVNGCRGVSGISHVGRPVQHVAEHLVFICGIGAVIFRDFLLQVGHGAGEAGEVIELTGDKAIME